MVLLPWRLTSVFPVIAVLGSNGRPSAGSDLFNRSGFLVGFYANSDSTTEIGKCKRKEERKIRFVRAEQIDIAPLFMKKAGNVFLNLSM